MRISAEKLIEREQKILDMLIEKGSLTFRDMTEIFDITESSARRIFSKMEQKGLVKRTYRGIILNHNSQSSVSTEKEISNLEEKQAIARKAFETIKEGDIIVLGNGSTIYELAKLLSGAQNIIVITTSIAVAALLYPNVYIEVQIVGGIIRPNSGSVIGPLTYKSLEGIHFDKAYIGADSISLENGITSPNQIEVEIDRLIISNSRKVYVLADGTKFDKVTLVELSPLDNVDWVITDEGNNSECIKVLKQKEKPRVLVVQI